MTLTLAQAVRGADTGVKVSYRKSGSDARNRLRDVAGNEVARIQSDQPVSNSADTTPPRLVRGEIDGGTMTLYFSEALDPDSVGGRFRVQVEYALNVVTIHYAAGEVAISGNEVTVGLGDGKRRAAVAGGRNNFFRYLRPTGSAARGLRDLAGNEVGDTQSIHLDNVTGAPLSVTHVAFSSDAGADPTYARGETIQVRLTFSRAVVVTGAPRLRIDFSSETGDEKWAAYASGSGSKVLEFAYTVAEGDASSAGVAVLANTLDLNGGTIRSASTDGENARLAHAGLDNDPNHKVDTTLPTLSTAIVDGRLLILTFNKPLGAAASLANDAFTVKKTPQGGTEQNVSLSGTPAIDGATVSLTLANGVLSTDTGVVKVSYTVPDPEVGDKLTDAAGNEVASFTDQPVTNGSRKPAVTGVEVTSDAGADDTYVLGETVEVTLTFSDEVAVTGTPRVQIDFSSGTGDEKWADYASGSGTTMLEFAYTVAQGDESSVGVAVLANTLALNGGTIESASVAGERANLAHVKLDHDPNHKVDTTPPTLSAATVDGARLTLTFSETLGAAASLANGVFTVQKTPQGGTEQNVSLSGSPAISGATVTLTLANEVLVTDTDVKVSYGKPTAGAGNRLRDAAGNEVASFSDEPVTNGSKSPGVELAHVDGAELTITFDEALGAAASLANDAFAVKKTQGGSEQDVNLSGTPAISGDRVTLTLANAVLETDTDVKVNYARPTSGTGNRLRDEAGNEVASFSDEPVTNVLRDVTPPTLVRGEIDGGTVTLWFSEHLDPDSTGGRYWLQLNFPECYGHGYICTNGFFAAGDVEISGNVVTVELGKGRSRAKTGMPGNYFQYLPPTDGARGLRDLAGNGVRTTTGFVGATTGFIALNNATGAPSVTGVAISSDAGPNRAYALGETIRVAVTFTEAVTVIGTPRVKIDFSRRLGGERWADYADGSGTRTLEFAYTVVRSDGDALDHVRWRRRCWRTRWSSTAARSTRTAKNDRRGERETGTTGGLAPQL